jgi:CBS domain-containing protein
MTISAILKTKGTSIISVPPTASILEVADIISTRHIGAVVVLDDSGALAGIVSERDLAKALAKRPGQLFHLTAEDIMTRDVVTATPTTSVDQAMEIMDRNYFRHLPVVANGRLAGIISIRDLVKYRLMEHEHDVLELKSYIARTV